MSDIVVVLTKVDAVPELTDRAAARVYVERHLPALLPKVAERIGGRPAPKPPLAPRGYDELFDFVIGLRAARGERQRRRRAALLLTITAVLALAGAGVWSVYQRHRESGLRALVNDPSRPAHERIRAGMAGSDPALQSKVVADADEQVRRLAAEIAAAGSVAGLAELDDRVKKFRDAVPPQFAGDADRLAGQVRARRRQVWFTTIEQKHKNDAQDPSFLKAMNDFLVEFQDGQESATVRRWRDDYHNLEWQRAKAKVKQMPANDAPSLAAKADAFEKYVERWKARHPDAAEVGRMGRAVALARQFAGRRDYRVRLVESGEFTERRWPIVAVHHAGGIWTASETSGRSTVKRWDESLTVSWQAGDALRVEFWVFHGSNIFGSEKLAATWAGRGPLQLLDLDGTLELTPDSDWRDSFVGAPKVTFTLSGVDSGDAKCLREFLVPGESW